MGRGGLLLIRRGAIFDAIFGAGGRLFVSLRRGCEGKSCLFVRFVRLHGGLVVIVASAVLGGFAVVVVVSAVVCGEGEGGIAGSDLSVPPDVRSHVGVGVGGIQGTAHKVPPGVLSSLFSGRRGATNAFACASCSLVDTGRILMVPWLTCSRRKWWRTSMCLVRLIAVALLAIFSAALLSS